MTEAPNLISDKEVKENVKVKDGMYVFEDYKHLRKTSILYKHLSKEEKNKWNNEYGVETYGTVFSKVISAEDSISDFYMSLPLEKQKDILKQPQVHSEIYKNSLKKGLIKKVSDDNNEYFDINLVEKVFSDFINLKGEFMIGDDLYIIDGCEKKVFLDVAFEDVNVANAEMIVLKTMNERNPMFKSADNVNDWSQVSEVKYYDKNWRGKYKKKVWAEIEGVSYLSEWMDGRTSDCSDYVHCDFILKAYARKRNFWGNYVISGNFWPKVEFSGTWDYTSTHWADDNNPAKPDYCLCGYYNKVVHHGGFPEYSCYPNENYMCETSPLDYTDYGNGYELPVAPHGHFRYDDIFNWPYWWARPIDVYSADIDITIDGKLFNFTW
jgi:hypothetical protein